MAAILIAAMDARMRYRASANVLFEALLADFDISDQIHAIRIPTPIIVDRDDWVTPPSQAEWMRQAMPHADVAIFEQSGHYPFIEEAEAFIETIGI
jgi:proline iminopeptidase